MKKESAPASTLLESMEPHLSLLPKEGKYLIGVSGGIDSIALLHLLLEAGYRDLIILHVNHQLRGGDAHEDALFVQKLAQELQLPFELGIEDVQARARDTKLSLETAAREARYEFFGVMAHKYQLNSLFLAHHADDQVETCFFNFLRGSGLAGLTGMTPSSKRMLKNRVITILRPLLSFSKERLRKYLEEKSFAFRHDASNDSVIPTRNRLRHQLFPLLDEIIGPSYRHAILRTATILAAEQEHLQSQVTPWLEKGELEIDDITALPLALQRRVIYAWLQKHDFEEIGFYEVERVRSLLEAQHAPQINLPRNRYAYRDAKKISIR